MVSSWKRAFAKHANITSRNIKPDYDISMETEQPYEDVMINPVAPTSHSNKPLLSMFEKKSLANQRYSDRLKIFIGTWNMYGRLMPMDLSYFLTKTDNISDPGHASFDLDGNSSHPYHLLVIGTQECERDISESLIYSSKEVWEKRLSDYLGSHYKLIKTETLTALHIAVFVWVPVAYMIRDVQSDSVKTGWANVIGNKGAVAVSVLFGDRSLLFITCHLRAHQSKLSERNANVERILTELKLPHFNSNKDKKSYPSVIDQFDHVFFFGDTNYRIDAKRRAVFDYIKKGDYNSLLEKDQLSLERRDEKSPLRRFKEHPIHFPPTYKLDAVQYIDSSDSDSDPLPTANVSTHTVVDNSSEYLAHSSSSRSLKSRLSSGKMKLHHHPPQLPPPPLETKIPVFGSPSVILCYDSSEKERVPSWTDRILWCDRDSSHHMEPPPGTKNKKKKSKFTTSISFSFGKKKAKSRDTICYSYNTILHESIIGVSDHLPVIGVFGVYIDEWASKPSKSLMPPLKKKPSVISNRSKRNKTKFIWWKRLMGNQR